MSSNRPQQMVSVNCPSCQRAYNAPVTGVIDVQSAPQLKTLLLQGRLNVSTCPYCNATGMMSVPMIYHDADKEFLFCLVPQELRMSEPDRQRVIGEMSRAVINALPAERRKGYLLNPRIFLTLQTLAEAILEGDGITKEMLQAQEKKLRLIQTMAQSVGDSLVLANMIAENADLFDQEFFGLLSGSVQAALQRGETESAERFNVLLEKLLEQTPTGLEIAKQQQEIEKVLEGIDENLGQEELVNRVLSIDSKSEDQILGVLISMTRPLVDYRFFQLLTERIDKAEQSGDAAFVDRAKRLRSKLIDLTQELDAQVRATMEEKAELLSTLLESEDPASIIRARIDEIDNAFMSVLSMNLQESTQHNHTEAVQALQQIRNLITQIATENMPPEVRFIQKLLEADYPDETRQMLQTNAAQVTPQLIQTIKLLAQDLDSRQQADLSAKLEQIAAQAQLVAGVTP
ncbi:MAG: CpXC domain-containing protein [Anaerolineae bacterium]|nr:CpXC domain-containing protein [Anaerolineae bacterium]